MNTTRVVQKLSVALVVIGALVAGSFLPAVAYAVAFAVMLGWGLIGRIWIGPLLVVPTAVWVWMYRWEWDPIMFMALLLAAQVLGAAAVAAAVVRVVRYPRVLQHWRAIVVVAFIAIALGWACRSIQCLPVGGGRDQTSPDKRYEAVVFDEHQKLFWGGERDWTTCSVKTAKGDAVWVRSWDHTGLDVSWRGDGGQIIWGSDSAQVTFRHQAEEPNGSVVTLEISSPRLLYSANTHRGVNGAPRTCRIRKAGPVSCSPPHTILAETRGLRP